jgi:hypothetical protein
MNIEEVADDQEIGGADDKRREAIKKIGLFGVYTAPVMLAMLKSSKALAASGGGGGGGGCCWTGALLAGGGKVGDARVGDRLLMMRPDGSAVYDGAVEKVRPSEQPCLRFETAGRIRLTCSYSTPMAVRRDDEVVFIQARDCLEDDLLPVLDDGGFRWEAVTQLDEAGVLPVALITANDGVYAAGDQPGRMIFTHNVVIK